MLLKINYVINFLEVARLISKLNQRADQFWQFKQNIDP